MRKDVINNRIIKELLLIKSNQYQARYLRDKLMFSFPKKKII